VDYQVKHCRHNLVCYVFNSVKTTILLMEYKACFRAKLIDPTPMYMYMLMNKQRNSHEE